MSLLKRHMPCDFKMLHTLFLKSHFATLNGKHHRWKRMRLKNSLFLIFKKFLLFLIVTIYYIEINLYDYAKQSDLWSYN